MGEIRGQVETAPDFEQALVLLEELDAQARAEGDRWTNKRAHPRRKARFPCEIRHIGPDGVTVVTTPGVTRDLSAGGLGFVSRVHFRRDVEVVVNVAVTGDQIKRLTGTVVYSRQVGSGWCLTGIQFAKVADARLTMNLRPEPAREPQASGEDEAATGGADSEGGRQFEELSGRDQALEFLGSFKNGWRLTTEQTAKVSKLAYSTDHVVRRATIPVLMQASGAQAADALITLLRDSNTTVQCEAADALGELRVPEAVDPLAELLKHSDEEVAVRAAQALGRLGDKRGLRVVTRVLRSATPLNRRAARALGVIVGQDFRPNAEGVAAARQYVKQHRLK